MGALGSTLIKMAPLSAAAQRAALGVPELHEDLAANRSSVLLEDVWFDLWPAKPKISAEQAGCLAGRPLTDQQIAHVLANERRSTVISALLHANLGRLTAEQLFELLATKAVAKAAAKVVLAAQDSSPELVAASVKILGGVPLLDWMRPENCSDDEVASLLDTFADWAPRPSRSRSRALTRIAAERPALIGHFAGSEALALKQAAAGSRHLRAEDDQWTLIGGTEPEFAAAREWNYILLALVNNPVCHRTVIEATAWAAAKSTDLYQVVDSARARLAAFAVKPTVTEGYDTVSDPDVLDWLISRSVPRMGWDGQEIQGRPFDMVALAANKSLSPAQARRLYDALSDWGIVYALGEQIAALGAQLAELHPDLDNGQRLDGRIRDEPPPHVEPPARPLTLPDDIDSFTVGGLAAGRAAAVVRQRLAEQLVTEDQWRVALGIIESASEMSITDFVGAVRALS